MQGYKLFNVYIKCINMENLNNVDEPNEKPHPKPTDDPGAKIETVTPDSQSLPDAKVKESSTLKSQENNSGSETPEIETVTPDAKNEDSSDDSENTLVETEEEEEQETDMETKDENDGTGIETVTPT